MRLQRGKHPLEGALESILQVFTYEFTAQQLPTKANNCVIDKDDQRMLSLYHRDFGQLMLRATKPRVGQFNRKGLDQMRAANCVIFIPETFGRSVLRATKHFSPKSANRIVPTECSLWIILLLQILQLFQALSATVQGLRLLVSVCEVRVSGLSQLLLSTVLLYCRTYTLFSLPICNFALNLSPNSFASISNAAFP